jgi:hypothetical protein
MKIRQQRNSKLQRRFNMMMDYAQAGVFPRQRGAKIIALTSLKFHDFEVASCVSALTDYLHRSRSSICSSIIGARYSEQEIAATPKLN